MNERHSKSRRDDWLEFWEGRELGFIEVIPYVLLVVATAMDVATRHGVTSAARVDLALALAAGGLMLTIGWLHLRDLAPHVLVALFLGLVGAMAAMVIREPLFGFYTFTGYLFVFRVLQGRPRIAGVLLISAVQAISQTGAGPYRSSSSILGLVIVYLINAGVATTLTWFGWVGNEQKARRIRAISELTEANGKLERSLRENAALHEQLVGQAHEAGIAEERQRMAREIHDTLAQGLAGIITQLQAAQRAGAGAGAQHMGTAIALARENLSEARRSVQALSPEPLRDARLPEAVRDVAQRWSARHGVPVAVTTTGEARVMRPELEVALLRTAQEALTNVAKHARASRVGLTLSYMGDVVTLDVRDDGVGLPPTGSPALRAHNGNGNGDGNGQGGFGLAAMRQRVEGVAGTLTIESEPEAGTAISATVPAIAPTAPTAPAAPAAPAAPIAPIAPTPPTAR